MKSATFTVDITITQMIVNTQDIGRRGGSRSISVKYGVVPPPLIRQLKMQKCKRNPEELNTSFEAAINIRITIGNAFNMGHETWNL